MRGVVMRVTLQDIADICGVSRGTVDRAINNKPRIHPETKQRILKVAKELGYRPDLVARSLAMGKTMSLGIVVFDILNRYFAQLVNSIENEAKKHGYFVNITLQEKDPEMEIRLINELVDRRVDGLILCPVSKGKDFVNFLKKLPVPKIIIGNMISPDLPFIGINEYQASIDATEMIISKGYKYIAFVCPPLADRNKENSYSHDERLRGFLDTVRQKDIKYTIIAHWKYCEAIDELLSARKEKIALFCSGDIYALEIMKHLKNKGIKIGEDIGIMGFDGIDTLQYISPKLNSIYNPVEDIGKKAVENIINLIEGKDIDNHTLMDYHIIEGNSL